MVSMDLKTKILHYSLEALELYALRLHVSTYTTLRMPESLIISRAMLIDQ